MMETFTGWARRTTSSFADARADDLRPEPQEAPPPAGDVVYRLKHSPDLPPSMKTAEVLQLVSMMSSRPLRRSWILERTRLGERKLDALLRRLTAQDALDVIDLATLPADRPGR